jgi:hypothetical protein
VEDYMSRPAWPSIAAALVLVAASAPSTALAQALPDQRAILMELYDATDGPRWKVRAGWGTEAPVCEWAGVDCSNSPDFRSVTRLALGDNQLRGGLPASLAGLPWLHTLDVTRNPLHGAVPPPLIDRANQNRLDLRIAGTSLDEALAAVTVQIDVRTGVCSGDVGTRMVIDASRDEAHIEVVRCKADAKAQRPVICLRAATEPPDLELASRALRRLGLVSPSGSHPRPGGVLVDHEVRYTTTFTWGNGVTGNISSRDDVGPLDAVIAQRLLIDLIPRDWDPDAREIPCEAFTWTR